MNAPADNVHLAPPHSIEAEQTLLGALLLNSRAFDYVADQIKADDFFGPEHRLIFGVMARLHTIGREWDAVIVFEELGRPANGAPGGLPYLTDLSSNSPGASNIVRHASVVRARSDKRALLRVAETMMSQASMSLGPTTAEIVAEAELAMRAMTDRGGGEVVSLAVAMDDALAYVQARKDSEDASVGVTTGLSSIDKLLGSLEAGHLVIAGARASVGKTVLAVHVAQGLAARGKAVGFFSLEMSRREIAMRVMAARSAISTHEMRARTNAGFPWDRMVTARGSGENDPLYIDDTPSITVGYLRAKARRIKRKHGLDVLIVDYLGLMKGVGDNRVQEIGSISRGLKALAKELEVPIIALAQLNRGVEGRTDKRPMLSDLRDSGDIEQDADVVLMLHREELYSSEPQWVGMMEVLVRKNRHGAVGEVALDFNAKFGILSDRSDPSPRTFAAPRREAQRGLN